MHSTLRGALVSLWKSQHSTHADMHYVGAGVFVADALILTAAHNLDGKGKLWARPAASATQALQVDLPGDRHPGGLDVALARVASMPPGAVPLDCDPRTGYDQLPDLHLCGYFEGRPEEPHPLTVLSFCDVDRHYVTSLKHPRGHSGSAVCLGQRVWGIATRHYSDKDVHRGCVVAIHQVWPWLAPYLGKCGGDPAPASARPDARAHSRRMLQKISKQLGELSAFPILKPVTDDSVAQDFLVALRDALDGNGDVDGEHCVEALMKLTRALVEALGEPGLDALSARDRQSLRRRLHAAMGGAAKLCLDMTCMAGRLGGAKVAVEIPAETAHGATLVVRDEPEKSWVYEECDGLPQLRDPYAMEFKVELGEGRDARQELTRLIHANLSRTGEIPKEVPAPLFKVIGGYAHSEAREGRARYIVRSGGQRFPPGTEEWLHDTLHVGTLGLAEPDGRLYTYDENLLFGRLQEFLRLLDRPEWKS